MQSLQPGSVRDLRSYLDNRSPDRSPERPTSRGGRPISRDIDRDYFGTNADYSPSRHVSPTPAPRFEIKDTPALRPSRRSFLGENTPPSATMQALQSMSIPQHMLDPPMPNANNKSPRSPVTTPPPAAPVQGPAPPPSQPLDSISSQLYSINNIVSSLQRDMSQLARRSKDNATDLISLKDATNTRDEDIRKSLKDLLSTMTQKQQAAAAAAVQADTSRCSSLNLQDPHMTPTKQFNFPRMSPSPWADERMGSPNPYSVEGAASVAMLEKIIREMVTKDGQERLVASLQKLVDKATGETAKKVAELAEFVKSGNPAGSGVLTRSLSADSYASPKAADFVSEEMLKYLRKIKDSIAEAEAVTTDTNSLIQDLRSEILGMGRELARKVEEAEQARSIDDVDESEQPHQDINAIVQEGIANLKVHMDKVMRERRRQSSSTNVTRNTVDSNEVHDVVKSALTERGLDQYSAQGAALDKEAIISAVREAYDGVQISPNAEIQPVGLEKEEILQCMREGLQDFNGSGAITKEDIENIVHDSLQEVQLPPPINEIHEMREEILMAVRDCLEDFKPSLATDAPSSDALSREVLEEVVRQALAEHQIGPLEMDLPEGAIQNAVLDVTKAPNEAVMERLQTVLDDLHSEFQGLTSVNERDTEQVLTTLREGLDGLRTELQGSVSQTRDVSQDDAVVDNIKAELEKLREDVQGYVAEGPRGDQAWSRGDMVTYLKSEFENLHEKLTSQFLPSTKSNEELLAALNAGFDEMKSQVAIRSEDADSNDDISEAIKHEFDQLKEVVLGDNTSNKNDVLEKLQAGLDGIHVLIGEKETATTSNDDMLASMKSEFEQLRETLASSLVKSGADDKDDVIGAVRELVGGLEISHATTSKDNVALIRTELESLKESLGNALVPTGDNDKTEVLMAVKNSLEEIKVGLQSAGVNEEILEAFRGELEHLRQSEGITRQNSRADTEEVLESVRLGLDDLRSHLEKKMDSPDRQNAATTEIVDTVNDGLESLRADFSKLAEKPVDQTISYEILDTLKDGIAALREDIDMLKGARQEMYVEEDVPSTGTEIVLADEAPAAQATSRELVDDDTAVQTTSRDIVEDALQATPQPQPEPQPQSADFAKMELILAQIQDKVEAMDVNMQNAPALAAPTAQSDSVAAPGTAMKEDLVAIEGLLKDVQAAVLVMQDRETPPPLMDGIARKEDTDAIETLLANTKAKVEEIVLPDPATVVTKENLEDVELVVRTTSEALEALAKKIEDEGASKADVTVVQVIADDIKVALDEMKAAQANDEANPQATKADIDAVTLLVDDLKVKMDDLKIPTAEELAAKADVEQLTGLIHDFRDSHDQMKDQYEQDILMTATKFDERRAEAADIVENITIVKTALDEMRDEIKTNLIEGGPIEGLQASFKTLEETIGSTNVTADVKELMETVTREFERAHGSIEGLQNDHAEKSALHLEKHDEIKDAIIAGFTEGLEDKFNTLMAKYDDAQMLADEQARVMKEKSEEQEKILETTKTMADELRLTIDTLGATIAGMNERFEGATAQWSTDSTTVFGKVDETLTKFEEQKHETLTKFDEQKLETLAKYDEQKQEIIAKFEELKLEDKTDHSQTRDEINAKLDAQQAETIARLEEQKLDTIAKMEEQKLETIAKFEEMKLEDKNEHTHTRDELKNIETTFNNLQDNITEYHPKFMVALTEIGTLVKAHWEHAQKTKEEADENVRAWNEEARTRSEELQTHFANLPKLLPAPAPAIEPQEKYDDAPVQEKLDKLLAIEPAPTYNDGEVHEKLDKLLGHADEAEKAGNNLEKLDEIHAQVKVTAAELSDFVAKQTQFITDGNDAKEREAEELALLIERRTTQKEQLDIDLESLRAEKANQKEQLSADIQEMKAEKERVMAELKEEKERVMAELQEEKDRTMQELKEEKDSLLAAVAALQAERENLANQKVRLTGEVSSLHTALDIRREELNFMDTKADALERRILNGIMDHSRALMMTKGGGSKSPTKLKKRMSVDINSEDNAMPPQSAAANGLSFALKPRPAIRRNGPSANPAQRRILSLSQISGNAPTGAQAYPTSNPSTNNGGGLGRSHSVKTTNSTRKGSWGGRPSALGPVANKENGGLNEASAPITHAIIEEDAQSETGTERRYSIDSRSYPESYAEGETPGYDGAGSEYTYHSGSYMTGSDIDNDRRTSYGGQSARSAAPPQEVIDEEGSVYSEDDEPTLEVKPLDVNPSEISTATADSEVELPTQSEINLAVEAVKQDLKENFAPPSDSGVGTDLPTAALELEAEHDADYFRRAAEEEASTVG
jgi:DNA repair exonuclease SbcCD ATPase subunit